MCVSSPPPKFPFTHKTLLSESNDSTRRRRILGFATKIPSSRKYRPKFARTASGEPTAARRATRKCSVAQVFFLTVTFARLPLPPPKLLPSDNGSDDHSDASGTASAIGDTVRSIPELQQQNLPEPQDLPTMRSEPPSTPAGQFLSFPLVYKPPIFSAIFRLQSSPITPSRTGLCSWKTSGMPHRTFCSSLKVREDTLLRMFVGIFTVGPRSDEYRLLLGQTASRVDDALVFRQH